MDFASAARTAARAGSIPAGLKSTAVPTAVSSSRAILATKSVVENSQVSKILEAGKISLTEQSAALRGVADKMAVFQIP